MDAFERLWIGRKCGRGMGGKYVISSFLPLLVIMLITAALTFSVIFITSLSARIDRMLAVLGSGSIFSYQMIDPSLLPSGAEAGPVAVSEALVYAASGERAVQVKGVESGYFSGMRGAELSVPAGRTDGMNPLVVSSALADELGLNAGDRMTMLLYDRSENRTRPYLVTVSAIFPSVYPQLDSRLVYAPLSLFGSADGMEVLLPETSDVHAAAASLREEGYAVYTCRELNRQAYENIESSLGVLYVIFALVAVLAAYFSSDAAEYYVDRDRKDIAELLMLGLSRKRILGIYSLVTLMHVTAALLAGAVLGTALSLLAPSVIAAVSEHEPAFLEYYVRSFSVTIPVFRIFLMLLSSLAVSAFSVHLFLRRVTVANVISGW